MPWLSDKLLKFPDFSLTGKTSLNALFNVPPPPSETCTLSRPEIRERGTRSLFCSTSRKHWSLAPLWLVLLCLLAPIVWIAVGTYDCHLPLPFFECRWRVVVYFCSSLNYSLKRKPGILNWNLVWRKMCFIRSCSGSRNRSTVYLWIPGSLYNLSESRNSRSRVGLKPCKISGTWTRTFGAETW